MSGCEPPLGSELGEEEAVGFPRREERPGAWS